MSLSAIITHDSRIGPDSEVVGYRPEQQGEYHNAPIPRRSSPVSLELWRGDQTDPIEPLEIRIGSGNEEDGYEWDWRIKGDVSWNSGDLSNPALLLKSTGSGQIVADMARLRAYGPEIDVGAWSEEQRIYDVGVGADAPLPYLRGTVMRPWLSESTDEQVIRWEFPEGDGALGYSYLGIVITGANWRGGTLRIHNADGSNTTLNIDNTWGSAPLAYTRAGRILSGDDGLEPGRVRTNRLAGGVVQWPAEDPTSAQAIESNSDGQWLASAPVATRVRLVSAGEMSTSGNAYLVYPRRTIIVERADDKDIKYIELTIPAQPTPEGVFTLTSLCIGPALVLSWRGERGWSKERGYTNPTNVLSSGHVTVTALQAQPSQELRLPGGIYVPSLTAWSPASTAQGYRRSEPDTLRQVLDQCQGGLNPLVYAGGSTFFEGKWRTSEPDQMFIGRLNGSLGLTQLANDEGGEVWQIGELRLRGEIWQ